MVFRRNANQLSAMNTLLNTIKDRPYLTFMVCFLSTMAFGFIKLAALLETL